MRPQQNRRMRGRGGGGNNRKSPNPLTRSYESNGPDVKIRGTAQQVAEKYTTLARDAQSSGDRVMAENYLQHAEHYNRLIAAAMAQNQQTRQREDEDEDREGQDAASGDERVRQEANAGSGPQPVIEGTPAEVAHEQGQFDNGKGAEKSRGGKANGSAEHEQQAEASEASEETEQAQRRPRRARRPRAKSGEGETEAGAADAGSDGEMASAVNS
jgi:hypothetical protein